MTESKDQFNRTLVTHTELLNNIDSYLTVSYDGLGRKTFESVPSALSSTATGTTYSSYDLLGRVLTKSVSQASSSAMTVDYAYDQNSSGQGNYTTSIDVNTGDRTLSKTYSGSGKLMQTIDALSGETQYAYDGSGNPIALKDANGSTIIANYNNLNQKLAVDDPNMGSKSFAYTPFGEVSSETDARNTISYTYDTLGRLSTRDDGSCSRPNCRRKIVQIIHHKIWHFYDDFATLSS